MRDKDYTEQGGVRMKLRKWSSEEKMAIVLEGLKGEKSVAEICREHQISQASYYRWRDWFLEARQRGVAVHEESNVDIYEKIVHPILSERNIIAKALFNFLSKKTKKTKWVIFEPGIGGGWLTLNLLECVQKNNNKKNRDKTIKVELTAIDTCQNMLAKLTESLKNTFGARPDLNNCKSESNKIKEIKVKVDDNINITLATGEALDYMKNLNRKGSRKFNIIFIFFLLHHLKNWEKALKEATKLLSKNGTIVISEVEGDQAAWSASFDKVYNINEQSDENRLKYLKFIRAFQFICDKYCWYNYMPVTAANISEAIEWLEENKFKYIKKVSRSYDKDIKLADWLTAGGILKVQGKPYYDRALSVFPIFVKDQRRQEFKQKVYEEYGDDIDNINKLLDTDIRVFDKMNYHILRKCQ